MQNKIADLNNHLFELIERLNDHDLTGDKLNEELLRAKGVADISAQILTGGNLLLRAKMAQDSSLQREFKLPKLLED